MRKLDYNKISEVKGRRELGVPIAVLARQFKVSRTTIYTWLNKVKQDKPLTE